MTDLSRIDLLDSGTLECPFPAYRTLRREAPVYRVPQTGHYVVTRYDLVMEAVRNTSVFSSQINQAASGGNHSEVAELLHREGVPFASTLISADPPQHTRYRSLVNRAFTARRVRSMQGYIQQIVDELIDGFAARGEVEFVSEFAVPLPIWIIADQLGVPRRDLPRFKAWSDASIPIGLDIGLEAELVRARLVIEFQRYFLERIEERRAAPGDDILGDLVSARLTDEDGSEGRPLDASELLSIIQQLLVAGNETTTNALAAGMVLLIENPDQLAQLRAGGEKPLRTFVEEVLRLESPVAGLFRVTTCDTELGGVPIPAGAMVNLRWAAANRDDAVFEAPDRLDVCRRNAGAQIGFGVGVHFCVGAMLAREEMFLAFRSLIRRLDDVRLAGDATLEHHSNFILRGLKSLPLRFRPAAERAAE
ncbi:MAG: cytochrome P450 [Alphaproteobacteria bacterium]|nr:cytochrome P450 [Alphaproteobacteria bacterium]